jgi:hypothetical protein
MKKESKNLLKTIISHQELIMKALNIAIPEKKEDVKPVKAVAAKKIVVKKVAVKKAVAKAPAKKAPVKTVKK